jgi:hypothetical protein
MKEYDEKVEELYRQASRDRKRASEILSSADQPPHADPQLSAVPEEERPPVTLGITKVF